MIFLYDFFDIFQSPAMMTFIRFGSYDRDIAGAGVRNLYQQELMNAAYRKVECAVRLRLSGERFQCTGVGTFTQIRLRRRLQPLYWNSILSNDLPLLFLYFLFHVSLEKPHG